MPARAEPALHVPSSAFASWPHEPANVVTLRGCDPLLDTAPGEPLAARHIATPLRLLGWRDRAVGVSVLFHLAVAAFFVQLPSDTVEIAGGAVPEVALLGNAPEDALSAGEGPLALDAGVTSVTLVTMLEAEPVTVTEAAIAPVEVEQVSALEDLVEPVAPDEVVEVELAETAAADPVSPDVAPAMEVIAATPASPVQEAAQVAETAETVQPLAPSATLAPEVLTAPHMEPADPVDAVPPASHVLEAPIDPVSEVVPVLPESTTPIEPAPPAASAVAVEETAILRPADDPAVVTPIEELRVKAERRPPAKPAASKPVPAKARPAKPKPSEAKSAETKRPSKTKTRAEQPAGKPAAKSGAKGKSQADARRGQADGAEGGSSAATGKGKTKSTAAGNAAVTNYPGKIVSKLRRALRYPSEARSRNLKGEVQVSFTVSSGGGVGGVRVVRSSGSPVLDRAAIETVRRAAPFPPIPDGAGRSSWPFTVPLAFTR